jgi:hypothetical protein
LKHLPGNTPASAAPRKKRRVATPAKFVVPPIPAHIAPKVIIRKESHLGIECQCMFSPYRKRAVYPEGTYMRGVKTFNARLLGTSAIEYATRKHIRAIVNW